MPEQGHNSVSDQAPNGSGYSPSRLGTGIAASSLTQQRQRALAYIRNVYDQGGWWPYQPGHDCSIETTAWCYFAVRDDLQIAKDVCAFLSRSQNNDGGWSTTPGAGKSDWCTSLAVLALREIQKSRPEIADGMKIGRVIERALDYLFEQRFDLYKPFARFILLFIQGPKALRYGRGWPWSPGCYHWVEPTSYALLALKLHGIPDREVFSTVCQHANQFLTDHACKEGGWNHGNHLSLGSYLPPYVVTTAEALLALQDAWSSNADDSRPVGKTGSPTESESGGRTDGNNGSAAMEKGGTAQVIQAAIDFLEPAAAKSNSAMALAWCILALDAYGKDTKDLVARLAQSQHKDGSFGRNIFVTALSVHALDAALGSNFLKLDSRK